MGFHIGGQGGAQLPGAVGQQLVRRAPAGVAADAAAVLQTGQKRVAQERLFVRHQGIPGGRREFGEVLQDELGH
ncbi:hypothetical protein D3C80_1919410 [compost metagenome]